MFTSFFASPNRWRSCSFADFDGFLLPKFLEVANGENGDDTSPRSFGEGQSAAQPNATEKSIPAPRNRRKKLTLEKVHLVLFFLG